MILNSSPVQATLNGIFLLIKWVNYDGFFVLLHLLLCERSIRTANQGQDADNTLNCFKVCHKRYLKSCN